MRNGIDLPGLEIRGQIGSGGQASVYRAVQRSVANREVVVKVYDRTLSDRDRRRFEREVEAAVSLSEHRHVVQIHDIGVLPSGQPYLVMEYCSGGSLADRLRTEGPQRPEFVVRVGIPIASALGAAHAGGVLHRDVKPANILLTRDGAPVLADFGIAVIIDPSGEQSATMGLLTPAYGAPELFHGARPSEAGDVYSLGATLYALLTGHPPRQPPGANLSIAELVRAQEQPVPAVPGAPARLNAVLGKAMESDPARRYPTMGAFRAALEGALAVPARAAVPVPEPRVPDPSPTRVDVAPTRPEAVPPLPAPRPGAKPVTPRSRAGAWRATVDPQRPVRPYAGGTALVGPGIFAPVIGVPFVLWAYAAHGAATGTTLLAFLAGILGFCAMMTFNEGWLGVGILAYLAAIVSTYFLTGGGAWRWPPVWWEPLMWLALLTAIFLVALAVAVALDDRRDDRRALGRPRWSGAPDARSAFTELERIPSARFFRIHGGYRVGSAAKTQRFAIVAGARVALVQWTSWPAGRYAVTDGELRHDGARWPSGDSDIAQLATALGTLKNASGKRAFLVVRPDATDATSKVAVSGGAVGDVEVVAERSAADALGEFLAPDAYTVSARVIAAVEAFANPTTPGKAARPTPAA